MAQALFFIALVVKGEAGEIITAHKQYAAQHFGASRALNAPPHLTLVPPFFCSDETLPILKKMLSHFISKHPVPAIRLQNFNCFPPRVIYVNVEPNPDLDRFQQALENGLNQELQIKSDRQYGFHPHVTIAFKDLREAVFPEAWQYYSQLFFEHAFAADGLALLEHKGQIWEVVDAFAAP